MRDTLLPQLLNAVPETWQLIFSCENIPVGCNFQTPPSVQFSESWLISCWYSSHLRSQCSARSGTKQKLCVGIRPVYVNNSILRMVRQIWRGVRLTGQPLSCKYDTILRVERMLTGHRRKHPMCGAVGVFQLALIFPFFLRCSITTSQNQLSARCCFWLRSQTSKLTVIFVINVKNQFRPNPSHLSYLSPPGNQFRYGTESISFLLQDKKQHFFFTHLKLHKRIQLRAADQT